MLTALEPSVADLLRLLQPTDPLSALLQLTREAKQQPEAEQQAEDGVADPVPCAKVEKKPPVNRREFGIKLAAVATHVASPSVTDPLRAEIDAVTGAYATSSPQKLLPQARGGRWTKSRAPCASR
ncbi:MAG: hypothetical protein ACRDZ4_19990 [Egibacteraceae bacterium]